MIQNSFYLRETSPNTFTLVENFPLGKEKVRSINLKFYKKSLKELNTEITKFLEEFSKKKNGRLDYSDIVERLQAIEHKGSFHQNNEELNVEDNKLEELIGQKVYDNFGEERKIIAASYVRDYPTIQKYDISMSIQDDIKNYHYKEEDILVAVEIVPFSKKEKMEIAVYLLGDGGVTLTTDKNKTSREALIEICEKAIAIPCSWWSNRDSHIALCNIEFIYKGLKSGMKYKIDRNEGFGSTWIYFEDITREQIKKSEKYHLKYDDVDDYFAYMGSNDYEMFKGFVDSFKIGGYNGGYLPKKEHLEECIKNKQHWY